MAEHQRIAGLIRARNKEHSMPTIPYEREGYIALEDLLTQEHLPDAPYFVVTNLSKLLGLEAEHKDKLEAYFGNENDACLILNFGRGGDGVNDEGSLAYDREGLPPSLLHLVMMNTKQDALVVTQTQFNNWPEAAAGGSIAAFFESVNKMTHGAIHTNFAMLKANLAGINLFELYLPNLKVVGGFCFTGL